MTSAGGQSSLSERELRSVLIDVEQLRRRVPGGIGTYASGLLGGLLQLNEKERPVINLLASRSKVQPDPLEVYGSPIVSSRLSAPVLSRLRDFGLGRLRTNADLVHCTSLGIPSSAVPLAVTVHDLAWRALPDAYPAHGRRWHERALHRATRRAEHFVVPSVTVADALCDSGLGVSRQRVTVIEEGADHLPPPDDDAEQRLLNSLSVKGEFLLACGTLEPRKNLDRLFSAYEMARSRLPEPWPLVVIGPRGWSGSARVIPTGVQLAGNVSSAVLAALYRDACLLAYVPLLEGFGLPVVEAMHAGTPVVSSNVPAAGGCTHLVDPLDVESIADGLLNVASDETQRSALRVLGSHRADVLTWHATAAAHVGLWRTLVGRAHQAP